MIVDTGTFQAITGRLAAVENELGELAERVGHATEAEAIIRRARFPESMLYGTGTHARRPVRARHSLRLLAGGKP